MISARRRFTLMCAALTAGATGVTARATDRTFTDKVGDAVVRRTDVCNCEPILPDCTPPDVHSLTIQRWQSASASTDPYVGSTGPHNASLARIDIVVAGVVCPPGPLGLGGQEYAPQAFGKSPMYGFFEIDVDDDRDTGGDASSVAPTRFLANAARFGARPYGSSGQNAAVSGDDLNQPWYSSPRICLSGADWVIALCGCFPITVVSTSTPGDTEFGEGDCWIVEGRFFQRTSAYQNASLVFGGSSNGLYDPPTRLRFQHSITEDKTTITLVCALDQLGAGALAGMPPEPIDLCAANQTSIAEGVSDLIAAANSGQLTGLARAVTEEWEGQAISSATNPDEWSIRFIVGTTYATPNDGLYVWTDVGFKVKTLDVDGDDVIGPLDRIVIKQTLSLLDGTQTDADGEINGTYKLFDFGANFHRHDVNSDGVIDSADLNLYPPACVADFDMSGTVTPNDIFAFLNAWFAGNQQADIDASGTITPQDIFAFLNEWFMGCP